MRVLFIHQAMIGSICATGQLISALLHDCSKEGISFFEICLDIDKVGFNSLQYDFKLLLDAKNELARDLIFKDILQQTQPDIVVYRPDQLTKILSTSILKEKHKFKLVLSVMDTWFQENDIDLLQKIFMASHAIWFISNIMQENYLKLFEIDKTCYVIANGIDAKYFQFPAIISINNPRTLKCRFFGSINEHQTYEGLNLVAETLSLQQGKFQFEIFSRQYQTKLAKSLLKYPVVSLHAPLPDKKRYFSGINSADVIVIPYSWSKESIHYLKYSFGNKIPECLASGKPIIAVGSPEIYNLSFLKSLDIKGVVTEKDVNSSRIVLKKYITELHSNYSFFLEKSQQKKKCIVEQYRIEVMRCKFHEMLCGIFEPN